MSVLTHHHSQQSTAAQQQAYHQHSNPGPMQLLRSYSTPLSSTNIPTNNDIYNSTITGQHNTPQPIAPLTPKRSGKMIGIRIVLLDESITFIQAQAKAPGRLIFDQICRQLNVLEQDYFGLSYIDCLEGVEHWLDLNKRINRQVGLSTIDPLLYFQVKFYTPDPACLEEEFTRYLFSLQIKLDLKSGKLAVSDNTAALLASYLVQAECGDYSTEDYPDSSYLSPFKFIPSQDVDLENRIMENHSKHIGQTPAEADLHLLETARRTELYGLRLVQAKDETGLELSLSVSHAGLVLFQGHTKLNTFSWAKIRKLSFKRKKFILKLHESQSPLLQNLEFTFNSRNSCKSFWKACVEHHSFFRLESPPEISNIQKSILTSRGSSFRYSGRTQKQMVAFVRSNFIKRNSNNTGQGISGSSNVTTGQQQSQIGHSGFNRSASFRSGPVSINSADSPFEMIGGSSGGGKEEFSSPSPTPLSTPQDSSPTHNPTGHGHGHGHMTSSQSPGSGSGNHRNIHSGSGSGPGQQQQQQPYHHSHSQPYNQPPPHRPPYIDPEKFGHQIRTLYYNFNQYFKKLNENYENKLVVGSSASALDQPCTKETNSSIILPKTQQQQQYITSFKNLLQQLSRLSTIEIRKEHWESCHGLRALELLNQFFKKWEFKWIDINGINNIYLLYWLLDFIDALPLPSILSTPPKLKTQITQILNSTEPLINIQSSQSLQEIQNQIQNYPKSEKVTGQLIRLGSLLKYSQRSNNLGPRLIILTNNLLIYATRLSSINGFRIGGQLNIYKSHVSISNTDNEFSFTFTDFNGKCILFNAPGGWKDRQDWIESIEYCIKTCNNKINELEIELENTNSQDINNGNEQVVAISQNPNSLLHVCWHRSLSISLNDIIKGYKQTTSSYLLRKFKNSPGWQKLFVHFYKLTLYFYKNDSDINPLATLPLLGYNISIPNENEDENIKNKNNIFKLSFKSHVYYFRADSGYSMNLWFNTIKNAL